MFIIGAFSSFLTVELMWSLWRGIIIPFLMPVLVIIEVEKRAKSRIPKRIGLVNKKRERIF
jgi:ABC-type uncharacterized transport system permease subunit